MKSNHPRQLLLGFQLDDAATLDNFIAATADAQLLNYLQDRVIQPVERFTFLWGRSGTGKTHLLQALCHELACRGASPIYLPLARSDQFTPELLEGLELLDLVCLDDIDAVAGDEAWEQALFNFYNRAREQDVTLVISANRPPAELDIHMPDLRSRLQSAVIFQVHSLADAEIARFLKRRASLSGIQLPDPVVNYVLQRHDRSVAALATLLQELDRQSLEQKRRITIPLVKEIMGW